MTNKHTQGFKEQAVQKALTRDDVSIKTIAQELNIGYSTLQKWIRDYKTMTDDKQPNQRPSEWSRKQQLQALIDTASMSAEQCSQHCREQGFFPHHLDQWRDSLISGEKKTSNSTRESNHKLKKENTALQKELRRKDKALAETAALLVLQKKFQALLEDRGE